MPRTPRTPHPHPRWSRETQQLCRRLRVGANKAVGRTDFDEMRDLDTIARLIPPPPLEIRKMVTPRGRGSKQDLLFTCSKCKRDTVIQNIWETQSVCDNCREKLPPKDLVDENLNSVTVAKESRVSPFCESDEESNEDFCERCWNHGLRVLVLHHRRRCRFKDCECVKCMDMLELAKLKSPDTPKHSGAFFKSNNVNVFSSSSDDSADDTVCSSTSDSSSSSSNSDDAIPVDSHSLNKSFAPSENVSCVPVNPLTSSRNTSPPVSKKCQIPFLESPEELNLPKPAVRSRSCSQKSSSPPSQKDLRNARKRKRYARSGRRSWSRTSSVESLQMSHKSRRLSGSRSRSRSVSKSRRSPEPKRYRSRSPERSRTGYVKRGYREITGFGRDRSRSLSRGRSRSFSRGRRSRSYSRGRRSRSYSRGRRSRSFSRGRRSRSFSRGRRSSTLSGSRSRSFRKGRRRTLSRSRSRDSSRSRSRQNDGSRHYMRVSRSRSRDRVSYRSLGRRVSRSTSPKEPASYRRSRDADAADLKGRKRRISSEASRSPIPVKKMQTAPGASEEKPCGKLSFSPPRTSVSLTTEDRQDDFSSSASQKSEKNCLMCLNHGLRNHFNFIHRSLCNYKYCCCAGCLATILSMRGNLKRVSEFLKNSEAIADAIIKFNKSGHSGRSVYCIFCRNHNNKVIFNSNHMLVCYYRKSCCCSLCLSTVIQLRYRINANRVKHTYNPRKSEKGTLEPKPQDLLPVPGNLQSEPVSDVSLCLYCKNHGVVVEISKSHKLYCQRRSCACSKCSKMRSVFSFDYRDDELSLQRRGKESHDKSLLGRENAASRDKPVNEGNKIYPDQYREEQNATSVTESKEQDVKPFPVRDSTPKEDNIDRGVKENLEHESSNRDKTTQKPDKTVLKSREGSSQKQNYPSKNAPNFHLSQESKEMESIKQCALYPSGDTLPSTEDVCLSEVDMDIVDSGSSPESFPLAKSPTTDSFPLAKSPTTKKTASATAVLHKDNFIHKAIEDIMSSNAFNPDRCFSSAVASLLSEETCKELGIKIIPEKAERKSNSPSTEASETNPNLYQNKTNVSENQLPLIGVNSLKQDMIHDITSGNVCPSQNKFEECKSDVNENLSSILEKFCTERMKTEYKSLMEDVGNLTKKTNRAPVNLFGQQTCWSSKDVFSNKADVESKPPVKHECENTLDLATESRIANSANVPLLKHESINKDVWPCATGPVDEEESVRAISAFLSNTEGTRFYGRKHSTEVKDDCAELDYVTLVEVLGEFDEEVSSVLEGAGVDIGGVPVSPEETSELNKPDQVSPKPEAKKNKGKPGRVKKRRFSLEAQSVTLKPRRASLQEDCVTPPRTSVSPRLTSSAGRRARQSPPSAGRTCALCRNHGVEVDCKGHRKTCPFQNCICDACHDTVVKRRRAADMTGFYRQLQKDQEEDTCASADDTRDVDPGVLSEPEFPASDPKAGVEPQEPLLENDDVPLKDEGYSPRLCERCGNHGITTIVINDSRHKENCKHRLCDCSRCNPLQVTLARLEELRERRRSLGRLAASDRKEMRRLRRRVRNAYDEIRRSLDGPHSSPGSSDNELAEQLVDSGQGPQEPVAEAAGEPPAGHLAEPVTEAESPAEHLAEPADEAESPVGHLAEPADEAEPPVEHLAKPVTRADPPAEHLAEPVSEAEPPAGRLAEPVTEAEPPAEHLAEPVTEVEPPAGHLAEPVTEAEPVAEAEPPAGHLAEAEPPAGHLAEPVTEAEPPAGHLAEAEPPAGHLAEPVAEAEPPAGHFAEPVTKAETATEHLAEPVTEPPVESKTPSGHIHLDRDIAPAPVVKCNIGDQGDANDVPAAAVVDSVSLCPLPELHVEDQQVDINEDPILDAIKPSSDHTDESDKVTSPGLNSGAPTLSCLEQNDRAPSDKDDCPFLAQPSQSSVPVHSAPTEVNRLAPSNGDTCTSASISRSVPLRHASRPASTDGTVPQLLSADANPVSLNVAEECDDSGLAQIVPGDANHKVLDDVLGKEVVLKDPEADRKSCAVPFVVIDSEDDSGDEDRLFIASDVESNGGDETTDATEVPVAAAPADSQGSANGTRMIRKRFCKPCKLHGLTVPLKGHKGLCMYRKCLCYLCNKSQTKNYRRRSHSGSGESTPQTVPGAAEVGAYQNEVITTPTVYHREAAAEQFPFQGAASIEQISSQRLPAAEQMQMSYHSAPTAEQSYIPYALTSDPNNIPYHSAPTAEHIAPAAEQRAVIAGGCGGVDSEPVHNDDTVDFALNDWADRFLSELAGGSRSANQDESSQSLAHLQNMLEAVNNFSTLVGNNCFMSSPWEDADEGAAAAVGGVAPVTAEPHDLSLPAQTKTQRENVSVPLGPSTPSLVPDVTLELPWDVSAESQFKCDDCSLSLTSRQHLAEHRLMNHAGVVSFSCELCPNVSWSLLQHDIHMAVAHDPPFHRCAYCQVCYPTLALLQAHQLTLHPEMLRQPYPCPLCPTLWSSGSDLSAHLRAVHRGDRPFRCDLCGSRYDSPTGLMAHYHRKHFNGAGLGASMELRCIICAYAFPFPELLALHHNTEHTQPLPFACPCGKRFKSTAAMQVHVRKMHSEEMFQCRDCPRRFPSMRALAIHACECRHMLAVTPGPFPCRECPSSYGDRFALSDHENAVHMGLVPMGRLCHLVSLVNELHALAPTLPPMPPAAFHSK